MPAEIQASEIRWKTRIPINFGFTGVDEDDAVAIMKRLIRKQWPELKRPRQCIYVIRVTGDVAIRYPKRVSPTIYIGQGRAKGRLTNHTQWLAPLVMSIPKLGLDLRVAEIVRRNNTSLCTHVEADMLAWFQARHGALPWFNRQRERSKEEIYEYAREAKQKLTKGYTTGTGNSFRWAIAPTKNNPHHNAFARGHIVD